MDFSHRNLLNPINLTLIIGLFGILLGTLGVQLSNNQSSVILFENVHETAATVAGGIIAWLKYRQTSSNQAHSLFWFMLGLIGYATGQIICDIQLATGDTDLSTLSNLFYLMLGPCITIGFLKEIKQQTSSSDMRSAWLDSGLLSVAMITFVIVVYISQRNSIDILPQITLIAYPATLFMAVSTALVIGLTLPTKNNAYLLTVIAGLVVMAVSWMYLNFFILNSEINVGSWLNIASSFVILLVAFSLSHLKIARSSNVRYEQRCARILRLLALSTVIFASFMLVISERLSSLPADAHDITDISAMIIFILAMIRQGSVLKERDQLLSTYKTLEVTQAQLSYERSLLKSLVSTIPDLVWLKNLDGVFLSCNTMFEKFCGAKEHDIIGKTDYDFSDKESADFFRQHDKAAMLADKPTSNEEFLTFADGSYSGLFETIKTPVHDTNGQLIGILGVARDISERKSTEEQLQIAATAFEMHEAIMITDVNANIIRVNSAFNLITGYSSEEVIGKNPRLLRSGRHDKAFYKQLWQELISKGTWSGEIWDKHKNGNIYPKAITITAVKNDQGEAIYYISIFTDISLQLEAKQALESVNQVLEQRVQERTMALHQAKIEAEEANNAKSVFLSSMSHELRTPMNAILGFAQLLEYDDALNTDQRENIQEIIKGGQHLLSLINEVLNLATIESGQIDIYLEPVNINQAIDECLTLISPLASARQISIQVELPTEICVRADRIRLKQVILNILSNAIKYNHDNGQIIIRTETLNDNRQRIMFTDTGTGLRQDQLADIFQPFNRLNAEHSNIEGTGIGLTITQKLIELMEGNIGVTSEIGVGSTFWIELTLEMVEMLETIIKEPEQQFQSTIEERQLVLYIDDNSVNLKLVERLLDKVPQIELLTSISPVLGIELAMKHKPDVIILDINMPYLDGYQVLEILQADQHLKSTPIIAVTANAMSNDVERGLASGFSSYLIKPFKLNELIETITLCINKQ